MFCFSAFGARKAVLVIGAAVLLQLPLLLHLLKKKERPIGLAVPGVVFLRNLVRQIEIGELVLLTGNTHEVLTCRVDLCVVVFLHGPCHKVLQDLDVIEHLSLVVLFLCRRLKKEIGCGLETVLAEMPLRLFIESVASVVYPKVIALGPVVGRNRPCTEKNQRKNGQDPFLHSDIRMSHCFRISSSPSR